MVVIDHQFVCVHVQNRPRSLLGDLGTTMFPICKLVHVVIRGYLITDRFICQEIPSHTMSIPRKTLKIIGNRLSEPLGSREPLEWNPLDLEAPKGVPMESH